MKTLNEVNGHLKKLRKELYNLNKSGKLELNDSINQFEVRLIYVMYSSFIIQLLIILIIFVYSS